MDQTKFKNAEETKPQHHSEYIQCTGDEGFLVSFPCSPPKYVTMKELIFSLRHPKTAEAKTEVDQIRG